MLDRSIAPPIQKISKLNITRAVPHHLQYGIPLYVINAGQHEIIKTEIILKSGKWYEHVSGISFFSSKMIMEGTSSLNSKEISQNFEALGAHTEIEPGSDFINISLYVLRKNLKKALEIMKECLYDSIIPEFNSRIIDLGYEDRFSARIIHTGYLLKLRILRKMSKDKKS